MTTPHPVQLRSRILLVDDDLDMLETLADGLGERCFAARRCRRLTG